MKVKVLLGTLALAAAAFAATPTPPPASSAANAQPAKDVGGEYEFIGQHPCVDGGALVAYGDYLDYAGDVILEVVLTRCPVCREDRAFYFDLTPRYGDLPSFRKALLATRSQAGPADDQPCPTLEAAVTVGSIPEEYIFVETSKHTCGTYYNAGDQGLVTETGHYYDVITATCPKDGATAPFYFLIDSFYGNQGLYPEFVHMQSQGTPPEPLAGRTAEAAYDVPDAAGRTKLLDEATHAADGAPLELVNRWARAMDGHRYGVADMACTKCGYLARLYFKLPPEATDTKE